MPLGRSLLTVGLIERKDGKVTVRIHNTNTRKIIHSTFSVVDGEAASNGDFAIDGVAGTAAKIELSFVNPASANDCPW